MPDNRDITERLEDPSYDGAIFLRVAVNKKEAGIGQTC